jgi:uncharacterized membrane protein
MFLLHSSLKVILMAYRALTLPAIGIIIVAFFVLIIILAPLMILGWIGRTLSQFGLGWFTFLLFLMVSLVGSTINIPIWRSKVKQVASSVRYVYFFGIPYPVPTMESRTFETILSINFGGAIMPVILSAYLLLRNSAAVAPSAIAIAVVAFFLFFMAKPVQGIGIVTPMFIPPLIAAISAIIIGGPYAPVAYTSGTLGTLIGADLFHLNSLKRLGAANMSIGGAGTFDGIFLTGLLAVLLAF